MAVLRGVQDILNGIANGTITLSVADSVSITALTGEVTATGPGAVAATVSNAAVIAKVLTAYVSGAGTVSASDSILTALQKIDGNSQNAAVIARVLTGYTSGAGTVASTDTILQAIQKLNGNDALAFLLSWQSLVRASADTATTSASAGNVTDMLFAIGASQTWEYEFHVFCTSSAAGGIKLATTVPTSATFIATAHGMNTGSTTFRTDQMAVSGTLTGIYLAGALTGWVKITGLIVNSTNAGNVQLQSASGDGAATATVKTNSIVKARRIA